MDITPLVPKGRLIIDRYGNGGFVVNGIAYQGHVLLLSDRALSWSGSLTPDALQPLLEEKALPELVLFGSGKTFAPLPAPLKDFFRQKNIAADAMDTGAACRTYNVLLSEGRRVAAALIAV